MIRETIRHRVQEAISSLGVEESKIEIDHTSDFLFGDYSTNVALAYAKELRKSPREAADIIVAILGEIEGIEKIEIAGPGFINFTLSQESIVGVLKRALSDPESFGSTDLYKGKQVLVEYTQPNPLKVFHIGHLMSNAIGESLTRLFEAGGAQVKRLNFQGDVGLHVGKALWGMNKLIHELPEEGATLQEKTAFLGKAYVEGARAYEEGEKANAEIKELNKKVYEKARDILELYDKGKEWSLLHFEEIYKLLGTKFDRYYFESETASVGIDAVINNPQVFSESDGAIVYAGEGEGLHTRVFITSQGLPTYEAKDLGLNLMKRKEFPRADITLVVTAEEQKEYMKVVKAALSKISPDFAEKFVHVTHGMMQLSTGKMSSRKGNVLSGEGIVFEALE